ncbi:MAG: 3-methyl-2-oxobutanoate dehydrogenase subunit VorB [Spirochaetaceae bacterium]|nr:3-methyl-2-oxobutanoate dehydrogenase subunit VorB [Spirochaetaceae bacterium]
MNTGKNVSVDADGKRLIKGNEAIAEAAIRAGCRFYAGYPITPQNEITAYMASRLPAAGGIFIQAESEVSAINMVYGAAAAGAVAMTSSSSPGVSLKQEGISYAAGADLPLVVVNVCRGGPGLGSIAPAQSDYFQSTRGGGHGDYRCIVVAPKSAQECAGLTTLAFKLTRKWRVPALVLADGLIGQMMEAVVLPQPEPVHGGHAAATGADTAADSGTGGTARGSFQDSAQAWCVGNMHGRESRHISSLRLEPAELDALTKSRFERYWRIAEQETRFECVEGAENAAAVCHGGMPAATAADVVIVAYGSAFRSCLGAMNLAREAGIQVSIFRPITLWPFPAAQLAAFAGGSPLLVVEMSRGQMVEDVKLALFDYGTAEKRPCIHFLGHSGGVIPNEEEICNRVREIVHQDE